MNQLNNQNERENEKLVRILAASTFLIFFQAFMVAPLIPKLAGQFNETDQMIGLMIPAYMIPYGIATLFYGLLSDRIGRRRIMLTSFVAFIILTAITAISHSANELIWWRFLTGLGASGVVPLALSLIGQLFPYEKRGRPLGWLFGAMAGGMAFGSTIGAMAEPLIGWRGTFLGVSLASSISFAWLWFYRKSLGEAPRGPTLSASDLFKSYRYLLRPGRGLRTYIYVFINSTFHSGVFTWLGFYFSRRYGLGEIGIGLALLGYGVPGFIFGPIIGRFADQYGRRWIIPVGLVFGAIGSALLIPELPVIAAAFFVTILSLGYDMTQPLLAGIVTTLDPKRAGQAMGLNVFLLFLGFGLGGYFFGELLKNGLEHALVIFTVVQAVAGLVAIKVFSIETHSPTINTSKTSTQ